MKRRSFIFGLILSFLHVFSSTDTLTLMSSSHVVFVHIEDHTVSDTFISPTPTITPTPTEIKPLHDDYPDDL